MSVSCDSLGRAIQRVIPLTDNIRQQIAVMCTMDKKPSTLRIDPLSWDALVGELEPLLPMYPMLIGPPTVFGLRVEFMPEPDFEVVE